MTECTTRTRRLSASLWPRLSLVAALIPLAAQENIDAKHRSPPHAVSLVQLLATPERYESQFVRLMGYCYMEFEEQALYLHKEDADFHNERNAIWLGLSDALVKEKAHLHRTVVLVEGTFTARQHGHLGAWPGTLTRVTRFDRVPTRAEFKHQQRDKQR